MFIMLTAMLIYTSNVYSMDTIYIYASLIFKTTPLYRTY